MEHREEVHEKIQRKMRYLLWDRAQIEEGEMEEQFNKEAEKRWRSAANAARITDETAGSEDRKRTSGAWQSIATWVYLSGRRGD